MYSRDTVWSLTARACLVNRVVRNTLGAVAIVRATQYAPAARRTLAMFAQYVPTLLRTHTRMLFSQAHIFSV